MDKSSAKKETKKPTKNRFVVDLGAMPLTEQHQRSVAAAIQGAVLAHLAANHPLPTQHVGLVDDGGIAGMYLPDPKPEPEPRQ